MENSKLTNYQITIGYKAVVVIDLNAGNEDDAKKIGLETFETNRKRFCRFDVQDDSYDVHGILNMDETWNKL